MERKWWGSDGATRNCCPFIKRRWGNLPCCWEKKDETIKKNKGKPSGLFNHLIYFCKKRQNKIMHRIWSPVRADLHVRKYFFFSFFYAFFHCLSPCPVFAVNLHYWENLREGMQKRSHPLSSVQFNLSQLLNALFHQRQKNNQAWAKEFNQYLYFYQSHFLCHTSIHNFCWGTECECSCPTSGLESLFKAAMLLSLCTSALPSSSGQLLLTSNKRETVWSQLDDGGNSYHFLHVTVWHKPEFPQGHLQGSSITCVIS